MHRTYHAVVSAVISAVVFGSLGCKHPGDDVLLTTQNVHPVDSPLHGVFVTTDQEHSMIGIEIPSGTRHVIRQTQGYTEHREVVGAVAGPDSTGLVAFIKERDDSYELKVITVNGESERAIFGRRGDPIWQNAVGTHLAISNHGGKVALIGASHHVQMPRALLQVGPLEVWDIFTKTSANHENALDQGLAWLPDGKNVVCVRLIPQSKLPPVKDADDHFGAYFAKWDSVPAVCIVNIDTRVERVLCAGISPVVSMDGSTILVADFPTEEGTHWRRVNIATGEFKSVPPHSDRSYVAVGPAESALFLQLPGDGETSGKTKYFSPLRGAQPLLLLKIGTLGADTAETMGSDFNARASISFGAAVPFRQATPATMPGP